MVGMPVDPNWFDGYSQRRIFEATETDQTADIKSGLDRGVVHTSLEQHARQTAKLFRHRYTPGRIRLMSHSAQARIVDTVRQPIHWRDVDLQAWHPLEYRPNAESTRKPFSINRPHAMVDLNNAFYNVAAMSGMSVFRVFDDVLFPLSEDRPVARRVENLDRRLRNNEREWIAEGVRALNVSQTAVSDYSTSSLGNLRRANGAVDWIQERGAALDRRLNGDTSTRANQVVNRILDGTQDGFWEAYRFSQRILVKAIDETLLNGIENATDRAINSTNREPSEIVVD
jgi:hypothetical protein